MKCRHLLILVSGVLRSDPFTLTLIGSDSIENYFGDSAISSDQIKI